jgi:hypothetical protein
MLSRIVFTASLFTLGFWIGGLAGELGFESESRGALAGLLAGVVLGVASWLLYPRIHPPIYTPGRVIASLMLGYGIVALVTFGVGFMAFGNTFAAAALALWLPIWAVPASVIIGCSFKSRRGVL